MRSGNLDGQDPVDGRAHEGSQEGLLFQAVGPSLQTSHSPPLFVYPACPSDEKPSQPLHKKATQSILLTAINVRACNAMQPKLAVLTACA